MEAMQQLEMPASVQVNETEAKLSFLSLRCWQDAMLGEGPHAEGLTQRMEKIIAEFDLLFGAQPTQD